MRFRKSSQSPLQQAQSHLQSRLDEIDKSMAEEVGKLEELEAPRAPVVPVEQGDEPIRALKAANLKVVWGAVFFEPLNAGGRVANYDMRSRHYGPDATAQCFCVDYAGAGTYRHKLHPDLTAENDCGFYAWKRDVPFPWGSGGWLLEVDLFGRVVEHEQGYRATRQRVLRISPIPPIFCEPPMRLYWKADSIQLSCMHSAHEDPAAHPVSVQRLRSLLNVEVDMTWATQMRDGG